MEKDQKPTPRVFTFVGFSKKSYCFRAKLTSFPLTFMCQVCQCVTPKLNTLPCGHWTCEVCLKGMNFKDKKLSRKVIKCALCKQTSREVSMTTTVFKSHIQKKEASCAQSGCQFKGTLRDVKRHAPFCPTNSDMSCRGCGNTLQRSTLSRHLREKCEGETPLPTPGTP